MAAGRPRVPDAVKKLHGTSRKDNPDPDIKHEPGEKPPTMPTKLKGAAAQYWKKWFRVLWDTGWVSTQSSVGFTMMCEAYGLYEKMRMNCERKGYTYRSVTKSGESFHARPEYTIMKQQEDFLKKWYSDFGFTGLAERRGMGQHEKPKPNEKEKIDIKKFVNG